MPRHAVLGGSLEEVDACHHKNRTFDVHALGVLCCFALFVCLTLFASFFHLSFSIYTCTCLMIRKEGNKQGKAT